MDVWVDAWMDGWMSDGWMDGQIVRREAEREKGGNECVPDFAARAEHSVR